MADNKQPAKSLIEHLRLRAKAQISERKPGKTGVAARPSAKSGQPSSKERA
jgi:hypothetical protein